jgi:hypothetical protein
VPGRPKTNHLAVASIALGLAAFLVLGPIGSVPGVILAHIGRRQIRESNGAQTGHGLAVIGLALNYLHIAITLVKLIVAVSIVGVFDNVL